MMTGGYCLDPHPLTPSVLCSYSWRKMKGLLCVLLVLPAAWCFDCTSVSDGAYEAGCKSFVMCSSGVATIRECERNQVYNSKTGACADESTVGPPCGTLKDCSNAADGKYADTDQQCTSYYTCSGGTFFGHNYCAGGLVFNELLQTCDWPADTDPPCGTKGNQRPTNTPPGSG